MLKNLHYNLIIRPEPKGGFTVLVPALPGCVTYGKSLDEARKMAGDAISAYLKSVKKHKGNIQHDEKSLVTFIDVAYA